MKVKAISTEEKDFIEVIVKEIRIAAEEEAKKILERAQREAQKIVEEARLKAEQVRKEKISKIIGEFKANLIRETAPQRLEIRNRYLVKRHEIITTYLDKIIEQIINKIRSDEALYMSFLKNCIVEALKALDSNEIHIYPCKNDARIVSKIISELNQETRGRNSPKLIIMHSVDCKGGIVASTRDGKQIFYNTIEAETIRIKEEVIAKIISELK